MNAIEKLEKYLKEIALKAVLKHPKAKLYAKVNHMDNFSLVMYGTAEDEIIDELMPYLLGSSNDEQKWWNSMHDKPFPNERHSKMRAFCVAIANEAYTILRK